ncbi:methionyl-tRNA formyltransferase [Rudanella paleaurantiibacter]|uniref:Methionyl-tRNA formyltransferase n=2 Tax=Rudanella paleaurantiibacter TaxID=2614655 RepID=A0A7J5U7Z5_9BACT|nr:methionyl-tRNA formyltransferase [Rudanella paleaurantiibacter]KAB7733310.1 methionyl-tRNA formyltransferase [Rudanella paleaurantiibacter]
MGTPDFAVASLQALLDAGRNVVAVVTAPDRPSGRGLQLTPSPVKQAALRAGLPVLQPEKLRDPLFLEQLASYQADLQVVVAFRMLPEVVWAMPTIGTFNLHGSLLPQYRGAAPINWAVINGETQTGVTTFFIEKEIDTGQMIFQDTEPIHPDDTAGTLHDRLMVRGAQLVVKTVLAIEAGNYPRTPQPDTGDLKPAPKLHRETTQINWNQPATAVRNFVRGLSPYPAAWTMINGRFFKIYAVSVQSAVAANEAPDFPKTDEPSLSDVAAVYTDKKAKIMVRAADEWLNIEVLQAEGKRRMTAEEYLRGNQL